MIAPVFQNVGRPGMHMPRRPPARAGVGARIGERFAECRRNSTVRNLEFDEAVPFRVSRVYL